MFRISHSAIDVSRIGLLPPYSSDRLQEPLHKSKDPYIHFLDRERVSMFVTVIVSSYMFLLLVGSIAILYYLDRININGQTFSEPLSIGILLGSTVTFAILLSIFTTAKRHEVLAASAG